MQDYADWEIVVSDNASKADVAGYVRRLDDARIRVQRFDRLITVTDNWNAALEQSSGDYFIMLGDDDALLPRALARTAALIAAWRHPEAIYAQALQYAYPDVIPGHPEPFLQTGYNEFLRGRHEAFLMPRATALRMVRGAMDFRIRYGFNMQHFVVSRALVEKLRPRGPFFQSPYPDYYAANAVLIAADSVVVTPEPLAVIGISPKSFGFYYFNQREQDGVAFLHNLPAPGMMERLHRTLVPGTNMNDSWLIAMETLAARFAEVPGLRTNHRRYRLLQYSALLRSKGSVLALIDYMRWWEYLVYAPVAAVYALIYLLPNAWRRSSIDALWTTLIAYPRFDPQRRAVPYRDILEAARAQGAGDLDVPAGVE